MEKIEMVEKVINEFSQALVTGEEFETKMLAYGESQERIDKIMGKNDMTREDMYIFSRLLEHQILFEEKVKDTPDDIYQSEILTPPWNTNILRYLKKRVDKKQKELEF